LELVIEEPDLIEYFRGFLSQLSWEYSQTVEVLRRVLLVWADRVNKVTLSAEHAQRYRVPGVDIFRAAHDAAVAKLGKVCFEISKIIGHGQ